MTRAHVGLGSNLGDRMAILDTAVRVLDADERTHVMAVSRVYETAPVGGPEQGPYLNAVAVLETDRSPRELLEAATAMGVEFIPCQMTMDMFGLKREDLIDEMGEPAGAATAIEIMTEADASLFI